MAVDPGGFRVLRILAQNDHSRVYLARKPGGTSVVVKELLFSAVPTAQVLELFERECALLERVDHPEVPRFLGRFQVGTGADVRLYLVQEYVAGESLAHRVKEATIPEVEVLRIGASVLSILEYLHGLRPRVIHRDVKPANLIIDEAGAVHLVDFGAARLLEGQETHRGTLVGTFGYMPLEQLGGTIDESADLYALGATLLHLLTGREPSVFLTPEMQLRLPDQLPVSPATRAWLARLVAPRKLRFRSAAEALAALAAPPPSWWRSVLQRARSASSRPVQVALFLALLLATLLAVWMKRTVPADGPSVSSAAQLAPSPGQSSLNSGARSSQTGPFDIPIPGTINILRAPRSHSCNLVTDSALQDFQFLKETDKQAGTVSRSLVLVIRVGRGGDTESGCDDGFSFEAEQETGARIRGDMMNGFGTPLLVLFPAPTEVSSYSIALVRHGEVEHHLQLDVPSHKAWLQ